MALTSMTGFARRDGSVRGYRYAWEIRSVNGRGLDLRFRVPAGWDGVEAKARAKAGEALARGNVSATLQLSREGAGESFRINTDLLDALIATARRYAGSDGLRDASVDGLMAVKGVVEIVETVPDEDERAALEADLTDAFAATLKDFVAARRQEGRALAAVLGGQVDEIERLAGEVEALPARTPEAIRARLEEQLAVLLGREDLDPARLHQEAALLATKADVREELDRLRAHVAQARELMAAPGAVGRRLDFLAQEFNRETNTLCSKSNDTALTRLGLSLKAVVDQFKEQVQNVE
jgi:uncharacterized protein (TIGR00255 family)